MDTTNLNCVIIGASHAGANCAMELRKQGWQGNIYLIDTDAHLPYHRPPLSKEYLSKEEEGATKFKPLFALERYQEEEITLQFGLKVTKVIKKLKSVILSNGETIRYDKLVIATGASANVPPIEGIESCRKVSVLRSAKDAIQIQQDFKTSTNKEVVIIGGGYIGLETAASLRKLGGNITVLEREERILARVAPIALADYFQELHTANGVKIHTGTSAIKIKETDTAIEIQCNNGNVFTADVLIVGTGVKPNTFVAEEIGAEINNGIKVDENLQTTVEDVYAIGDVAQFYHPTYKEWMRLESVQNAVDQAKIVASNIVGNTQNYNAIPWFWSDQYHVKLQMVGLSKGFTHMVKRTEADKIDCFSIWYFKNDALIAVDAVNNGKAFVLGGKFIQNKILVDPLKIADNTIPFKPNNFIKTETNAH
ncbi:FAD-dependent oxidoreductase [Maribacter sp. 6B07]|uniref:NAD(P)/FAD-dependent oxidoreductase n=1 Tax=Maribacter sp. 6B07 TaxID=2045442 RepID=UPI001F3E901A|nr:FAD-dependent oxidoreductase [Maribacter sp. 6B07]